MRRGLLAGAAYFAMVFAAGFVLGAIRTLWLAPALGEVAAVLIEIPFMLAIAWRACAGIVARMRLSPETGVRVAMGAAAVVMLWAAEVALTLMLGAAPADVPAAFATPQALLGIAAQILFAAFPLILRGGGGQGA